MPSENVTLVANFEAGSSSNTPETVLVHGGTFQMGDTRDEGNNVHQREKPVHTVILTYDFLIGKYEVTFDQFDAYCEAAGINEPSDAEWGRGQRPVINVNWDQAVAYCNWLSEQEGLQPAYDSNHYEDLLDKNGEVTTDITQVEGYRLPTEAEWEYAARGGHEDITNGVEANDYKYVGSNTVDEVAWYRYNSSTTQEVGQKLPNELGLYDMSGNVWEWCHDQFEDYSAGTHTNPIGVGSSYRIKRGGSWYGHEVYAVDMFCRVAYRGYSDSYGSHMGFRIAKTVVK